jgi:hypothetical protein
VVASLHLFAQMIVFPLLAVVAFVLARRNDRLPLAALFASLGVSIYGFWGVRRGQKARKSGKFTVNTCKNRPAIVVFGSMT